MNGKKLLSPEIKSDVLVYIIPLATRKNYEALFEILICHLYVNQSVGVF